MAQSANLGFPRLGINREWKRASEAYWAGKAGVPELLAVGGQVVTRHWKLQLDAGLDVIPCNDFAWYDHVLDTAAMVGAVPPRYGLPPDAEVDLDTYYAMARGRQDVVPMEMTKWFDTNYHYIVPEFQRGMQFRLASHHIFAKVEKARAAGVADPRPVLVGPVTFLLLGKTVGEGVHYRELLDRLLPVYLQVLSQLAGMGVGWVQIDEPILVTDLDDAASDLFQATHTVLTAEQQRPKLMLTTYFGALEDNLDLALGAGCEGLHLDLVRAPGQLDELLPRLDGDTVLSLGVVDGRNVWRSDLDRALALLRKAAARLGGERIQVAPSCSLLHSPIDLNDETELDPDVKRWLAFGRQKLQEVVTLTRALNEGEEAVAAEFAAAREALEARRRSPRVHNPDVRERTAAVTPEMAHRPTPFAERYRLQSERLGLPELPTTTIGSFPQTHGVRRLRADLRRGRLTPEDYGRALERETTATLRFQEEAGLDLLVHGEFERNDMVEYFGEQMEGFIFTRNGWVQSYGTRAVKPPIIFGDVRRPEPMTVRWSTYAQSQTSKPVKGMLTGPVTMLQWSFVRDDQPRRETCLQLALAIRDEVGDLETAGIRVIQIDEPALREGLPLRRSGWDEYLDWAVESFRIASSGVRDETQMHTHMCYSEFNDIIRAIAAMDADVISIEASRSRMELLDSFKDFTYPNAIGPGVWDIHSPRVPSAEEMAELIRLALRHIPRERLWVNPDCGLKTRRWEEVKPALMNMVAAVLEVRGNLKGEG